MHSLSIIALHTVYSPIVTFSQDQRRLKAKHPKNPKIQRRYPLLASSSCTMTVPLMTKGDYFRSHHCNEQPFAHNTFSPLALTTARVRALCLVSYLCHFCTCCRLCSAVHIHSLTHIHALTRTHVLHYTTRNLTRMCIFRSFVCSFCSRGAPRELWEGDKDEGMWVHDMYDTLEEGAGTGNSGGRGGRGRGRGTRGKRVSAKRDGESKCNKQP